MWKKGRRKQAARQQARHGRKKQPELFADPHPNKSPNSVATLRVLTVRVKARWLIDMVSYVCAFLDDPYSTKVPLWDVHALCISTAQALSYVHSLYRRGTFGTFWGLKRRFVWEAGDIGHFFIHVTGVALLHVAKTLASVGKNEKCFWRSFFVAVLWNRCRIWFGTWWWFRLAGTSNASGSSCGRRNTS